MVDMEIVRIFARLLNIQESHKKYGWFLLEVEPGHKCKQCGRKYNYTVSSSKAFREYLENNKIELDFLRLMYRVFGNVQISHNPRKCLLCELEERGEHDFVRVYSTARKPLSLRNKAKTLRKLKKWQG